MLKRNRRDGQQMSLCSKIKDGRVQKVERTEWVGIEMHLHEEVIEASSISTSSNESTFKTCRRVPKHWDASSQSLWRPLGITLPNFFFFCYIY